MLEGLDTVAVVERSEDKPASLSDVRGRNSESVMNEGVTMSKSTGTDDFTLNSPVSVQSPSVSVVTTDCADKVRVMRRSPVVVVEPAPPGQ